MAVEGAMAAIPGGLNAENVDFVVDKAKANLASMWSTKVDGRVSVELGWWLVNDADMTKLGCPVAQPRFISRPSASINTE